VSTAYLALGGNLGDVLATFRRVVAELEPARLSSAYRTRALLPPGESGGAPDYWNAVCELATQESPRGLLERLHAIERTFGRERRTRWAARTLDLDLLLYDDVVADDPALTLPHPGLSSRPFVLVPLVEIAPDVLVPPHGRSAGELLAALADPRDGILERRSL
jgi:2-amino-4-hydroxy-6-hydroxymethyldihydropteridine diphosphokinase